MTANVHGTRKAVCAAIHAPSLQVVQGRPCNRVHDEIEDTESRYRLFRQMGRCAVILPMAGKERQVQAGGRRYGGVSPARGYAHACLEVSTVHGMLES